MDEYFGALKFFPSIKFTKTDASLIFSNFNEKKLFES